MPSLNLMHEFDRFPLGGYQVKPASRHHQALGYAEHAIGNGIAMMMVVEEPTVDVALVQRRLNGRQVHGQASIVNKGSEFGRMPSLRGNVPNSLTRKGTMFHKGGKFVGYPSR